MIQYDGKEETALNEARRRTNIPRTEYAKELLGDSIFEQIKREIVECRFAPNDMVAENSLATQFGVSKGPVREALKRLAEIGWVRALPRVGYVITPVRVTDVDEIFAMRLLLEPDATRLATARARPADLERLERLAAAEVTAHGQAEDSRGRLIAQANSQFHNEIARLSGNGRLARAIGGLVDELERVIHLLAQDQSMLIDEHPTLVALMRTGDQAAAADCMQKQLEFARTAMRAAAMSTAELGVIEQQHR